MSDPARRQARVVLIDSGVKVAHPQVQGQGEVVYGPTFHPDGTTTDGAQTDLLGHGTAAAATILEHAPGSWVCSLKVFHDTPECPFEVIMAALEHALGRDPHVVNLSLGTPRMEWVDRLSQWLDTARANGVRVVAPADWRGQPSHPGGLPGADGVVVSREVPRDAPVHDGRWWHGSPYPRPIPGIDPERWCGPSFAVANVSGSLARSMVTSAG